MATTKISELPAASTLTGAETLPIVQGGVTKKVTTDRFARLTDAQRAAGALGVPAVLPNGGLVLPDGVVNNNLPSIRPSLNLDFANSQTVDPRITFTRASTATRTNAKGLIESVASGVPRIDFDPVTLACKGLLIEEQRTNLLTYSEQFNNAAWLKSSTTVTPNAAIGPGGLMNAASLQKSAAFGSVYAVLNIGFNTYMFSVYVKAGTEPTVTVAITHGPSEVLLVRGSLNTINGLVKQNIGTTTTATNVGNGWWRLVCVATSSIGTYVRVYIYPGVSTGTETGNVYIWGAQLEAGAFPTSYIPTTTAAATRAADVATMTGANFSSWYRQDEGALAVTCDTTFTASNYPFIASLYGSGSDYISLLGRGSGTQGRCEVVTGGAAQATFNGASVGGSGVVFSEAAAYKVNDFMFAQNGTLSTADTSGTVPTATALHIGHLNSAGFANGHIRSLRYYPKRLASAELQALTV